MADLVIVVPSRGRPEAAAELARAFRATVTGDSTLVFAVDNDDPSDYFAAVVEPQLASVLRGDGHTMVEALNTRATGYAGLNDGPFAIGFMGDDHRPRTHGWDAAYLDALKELGTGIVYGNDLLQGRNLPTQCAMTSDIIRALGYMAPPELVHMYVDNFWRDLAQGAGCLRYLPDVVVEHMHPVAGKADWDEGHRRVNQATMYARDEAAYAAYRRERLAADVAKVRSLRRGNALSGPRVASDGFWAGDGSQHEWRCFAEGTVPEYTTPEWYATREHAPHLEQEGHRERLMFTASQIAREAMTGSTTLVDLGAGDGGLLSLLGPAIRAWGYDLSPSNLLAAKGRGVDVRYGDVLHDEIDWGTIAVATEMLEHLLDPHGFVKRIGEHARTLVCSSPRLESGENHYEFHTWAWDLEGYRNLLTQGGWSIKRQHAVGAFQVVVATR